MKNKIVTVFGGSGFVGGHVVRELAKCGFLVKVISRNPDAAIHLKTVGFAGQVTLEAGNIRHAEAVSKAIRNSYAVVNLVGIMFERGGQSFSSVHAQGTERIAKAAKAGGVRKLVHVSSLGVDRTPRSKYARTKAAGEKAIISAFPDAVIIRPSVIFGREDQFFNNFAKMAKYSPALPLIGGGKTRFQPVYVGDVAKAVVKAITCDTAAGKVYEAGGPAVYTFKEILEYITYLIGRKRLLIPMPFGIASLIGAFAEFLPHPPITRDQVRMLQYDNVVSQNALHLDSLEIPATPVEAVVPEYLAQYK